MVVFRCPLTLDRLDTGCWGVVWDRAGFVYSSVCHEDGNSRAARHGFVYFRFVMGNGNSCTANDFVNFGSISVVFVVLLFISTRKTRRVGVGVVGRVSCVVCPKTGAIRQLTEDKLDATCWRALWDGFWFCVLRRSNFDSTSSM